MGQGAPHRSRQAETLDLTIAGIGDLDSDQLRLQWRNHLGGTAPAFAALATPKGSAYRLQAAALGDLDKLERAPLFRLAISEGPELGGNSGPS
jgi:hypothetical protein